MKKIFKKIPSRKSRRIFYENNPIDEVYYHVSPSKFYKFRQAPSRGGAGIDLGFHFGSENQAYGRIGHLKYTGIIDEDSPLYLYKVRLNMNNTLQLEENRTGSNTAASLLRAIMEKAEAEGVEGVSSDMIESYNSDKLYFEDYELVDIFSGGYTEPEEQIIIFRKFLNSLGYDSISYENKFEGTGLSYIVFDPAQIEIVDIQTI